MAILNYTTEVNVNRTVGEIQSMLAKSGARKILLDYDDNGAPVKISFMVRGAWGDLGFQLPANADAVFAVISRQASAGKIPRRFATREQAGRVAWRIVKDWLEAQMAIIEAELVTLEQVFLPYMTVPGEGGETQSLYELMQARHFDVPLLPSGEK